MGIGAEMCGWVMAGGVATGAALLVALWIVFHKHPRTEQLRRQFQQQREHLEADFLQLASASGKPRGLRWKECEWGSAVEFARDRQSGQFTAIAGVSISFEAIPGSDMEGLPAVGNLRSASALFIHDGTRWRASNRTVFNLNPEEVLSHFAQQYERVSSI
jgi:hypothetical protein